MVELILGVGAHAEEVWVIRVDADSNGLGPDRLLVQTDFDERQRVEERCEMDNLQSEVEGGLVEDGWKGGGAIGERHALCDRLEGWAEGRHLVERDDLHDRVGELGRQGADISCAFPEARVGDLHAHHEGEADDHSKDVHAVRVVPQLELWAAIRAVAEAEERQI